MNRPISAACLTLPLLLGGVVAVVTPTAHAQQATPVTTAPAAQPKTTPADPAQQSSTQQAVPTPSTVPQEPFTQPTGQTPATPRPGKIPDTAPYGVPKKDVKKTNLFDRDTPGQPIPGQPYPGDPQTIRTLDDALSVAFRRSPQLLLAREQAVRTGATVQQIKAAGRPQITLSGTISRLADAASGGVGGGGISPNALQNPFGVGLQTTPPGTTPVTLSGSSTVGSTQSGSTGQTSATGSSTSGSAGTAGQSRAVSEPGRQTTGGGTGTNPGAGTGGGSTGGTGGGDTGTGTGGGTGTGTGSGTGTNTSNTNFLRNSSNLTQESANLTISQFIDLTGIVRTAVRIGDLQEALSRLEIARNRQDVAFNVRSGFYSVLRAQAFVRVNEAAVAQSTELLRVTTLQRDAGVASDFDVLRAQTQLDNNRQALISSRNQVSISRNAFANTLGIDPSTPVDPESPTIPPVPDLNEDALIAKAVTQRPEYAQADVSLLVAGQNIRLARRGLEPYLNAVATGSYNPNRVVGYDKAYGVVGLVLTAPIFDGGSVRAQVEAARSDERRANIQKDQFTRGIKAEVQQAVVSVRDADERQRAAQQTVVQAREALRLANVRFKAGVDTQLSVNDAQTSLTQAETNLVNAQYDYLSALARLSRAVGDPQ